MCAMMYLKKYNYIDLARTITMFLVVINHILFFYSANPFWHIYADEKNDIAVYLCEILNFTVIPVLCFVRDFYFRLLYRKKKSD